MQCEANGVSKRTHYIRTRTYTFKRSFKGSSASELALLEIQEGST